MRANLALADVEKFREVAVRGIASVFVVEGMDFNE